MPKPIPHAKRAKPRRSPRPQQAVRRPPEEHQRSPKKYAQLLYGFHAVRAAWLNPARKCRQLWLNPATEAAFAPVLREAEALKLARPNPVRADKAVFDRIVPGTVHQGIMLDAEPLPDVALEALLADKPRLLVVLDQVTDPHNVGAVMRSAAAFGALGVIMTDRHAPGMTGVLAKAASGALEHVALVHVVNLARTLEQLRAAGFWCVGLAEDGARDLARIDLTGMTALVLGAEGEGLRRLTRERCDELACLPTGGAIGSLNVSNAAAVALYEVRRQEK